MKNKFTKGEWRREGKTVFIPVYNDKAGCETVNMILEKEEGESEANAKLIAAAPAMLDVCKSCLATLMQLVPFPERDGMIFILEDAIKKAV